MILVILFSSPTLLIYHISQSLIPLGVPRFRYLHDQHTLPPLGFVHVPGRRPQQTWTVELNYRTARVSQGNVQVDTILEVAEEVSMRRPENHRTGTLRCVDEGVG